MLELNQKNSVGIGPHMVQYMNMLQMTNLQLGEYLQTIYVENPVLEYDYASAHQAAEQVQISHSSAGLDWYAHHTREDGDFPQQPIGQNTPDLYTYVSFQIRQLCVSADCSRILRFLLADLDQNGYLNPRAETSTCTALVIDPEQFAEALALFQSLDPPGVGARSLQECLALQCRRSFPEQNIAMAIIEGHLEDLGLARYHKIAAALGVSVQEVRRALDIIRALNPRPGAAFSQRTYTEYISPDLTVSITPTGLTLQINDNWLPSLSISAHYQALFADSEDAEVKAYLSQKLAQARSVIQHIDLRRSTLLACAEQIVQRQSAFFLGRQSAPAPLSQACVAEALGLSASTVSRAISRKYLQCEWGTFPLSFFFPAPSGCGEGQSIPAAQQAIRRIIQSEDPSNPLSDSQLERALQEEGIHLSRRMIANYRKALGIPNSTARRRGGGA